jgi:glyoxylase-like metal-dependent hydrolase (beta-lactamase superfamily II)
VPGSPRIILTPGHTPGSAVLHVAPRSVLFVGDALATYAVTTGARGPQVAPFTADAAQAVASLARLEDLAAELVLPGMAIRGPVASRWRSDTYAKVPHPAINSRRPATSRPATGRRLRS